eukprot:5759999-Pyramimonas_sp.AAC.1
MLHQLPILPDPKITELVGVVDREPPDPGTDLVEGHQLRCVEVADKRLACTMACGVGIVLSFIEPNDPAIAKQGDDRGPDASQHLGTHASPEAVATAVCRVE